MPPKRKASKAKLSGSKTPKLVSNASGASSGHVNAIMGRKNILEGLLSSQEVITPGGSERSFEVDNDDGFAFKRSQEAKVTTPILKLRSQLAQLTDDDDDIVEIPKKNKVKPKPKPRSKTLAITLARRKPPVTNSSVDIIGSDIEDDAYIEQVSHHTIELDGGEKKSQKDNNKYRNTHDNYDDNNNISNKNTSRSKRNTSNRGKRILSVGNGFVAVPHVDVPVPNYYKLLDTSLPEPHRLRQLLIWCFRKKLDEESYKARAITNAEDKSAVYIAKVIKEEVLKDLTEGKVDISWYNKPEEENPAHLEVTTVPNPLNVANEASIKLFKNKLQNILSERGEWERTYQKSKKKVDELEVEINLESDTSMLKETPPDSKFDTILDELMIKDIESTTEKVKSIYDHVSDDLDLFEQLTYRLDKGQELVENLQKEQLNGKLSQLVNEFMTFKANSRKMMESSETNLKKETEGKVSIDNLWKTNSRAPTTRELLRGIARLDAKGLK